MAPKIGSKIGQRKPFRSDYQRNRTIFNEPFDNCVCIPLNKGQHTLVDSEDYEKLSSNSWAAYSYKRTFYAVWTVNIDGKKTSQKMHQIIMPRKENLVIDHINRNPLDNRKANLRLVTRQVNNWNRSITKISKSGYIGVVVESKNCYSARISSHLIGYFHKAELAAKMYDIHIIKRGDIFTTNFDITPEEQSELWEFYHNRNIENTV